MKKKTPLLRRVFVYVSALLVIFTISFTYFYYAAQKADAAWMDDGWRYRVAIPISAHTSLENNVYLALTGANGIDTTDTTKFQTDCGDMRFTDNGGNILNYYLTTACGLSQTGFNVFFDSFPAGAQTIYYYYGNAGAADGFSVQNFGTAATGVTLGSRGSETNSPVSPLTFWKMDEGYGQTINNSMSTGFSATLGPDATVTSTDPSWEGEDLCISSRCLNFVSTSSQYVNISSSISSVKSIGFWVRPTSTTTSLAVLNGAAGNASISVTSGTIAAGAGFTSPTIYVNGMISSTLTANTWQYVTVTTGTGITASNIMLGRVNTGYLNGFMDEVKTYGVALSAAQVKANYAAGLGKSGGVKGIATSLGGAVTSTNTLSNGLVGYWKMDEASWATDCSTQSALDASGNSNSGTPCPNASAATLGVGKFGTAGSFDGTNDYVQVANNSSIKPTSQVTVSSWFYHPSDSTNTSVNLFRTATGATDQERLFASGPNSSTLYPSFYLTLTNAGAAYCQPTTATLSLGVWSHITGTYDGNTIKVYLNGVLTGSCSYPNDTLSHDTNPLWIGSLHTSGGFTYGKIDEVRVYNRSLTAAEIGQLAQWTPGPIGYWKMDENNGATVNDSSGNNFASTMMGNMDSTNWIPGKQGSGLKFDGVDDHINIYSSGLDTAFNPSQGALSAWIRIPSAATWADTSLNRAAVQLAEDTSNLIVIRKTTTANQLAFIYTAGGVSVSTSYSTSRTDWIHVALVWDKARDYVYYYVDGVKIDEDISLGTWNVPGTLGSTRANIGSRLSDGTDPFQGYIDDVRIYNYPIDSSLIIQDMNGVRPVVGNRSEASVAHWRLDEGGSTSAYDSNATNGGAENLTLSTALSSWTNSGKFGSAFYAGGSRWATVSDTPSLDFVAKANITFSFWLKSSISSGGNPPATEYIINKAPSSATNGGYAVYANTSGNICFGIDDDNASFPEDSTCSSIDVYDNTWHHIVAMKTDTSKLEIFVDGVLSGTPDTNISSTANSLENTSTFYLGSSNAVNDSDDFNGYIDEVQLFRIALTQNELIILKNGDGVVLGSNSQNSAQIGERSTSGIYCVPGDTSSCGGPVGEWKFEEKLGTVSSKDTSGNANDMTFNGSIPATSWTSGKYGAALRFDGVDDYTSAAENGLYESTNFTLETWVRFDTLPAITGEVCTLMVKAHPTSPYYSYNWTVRTTSDILMDWTNTTPTHYYSASTAEINQANTWYHLVVVKNGTAVTHYINGLNKTSYSDTMSGTTYDSSSALWIGAGGAGTTQRCKAVFDESRVFDYARTPAQVAWDYNQGKPVGWYKIDECQGSSIYDSMGNATAGTITPGAAPHSSVGSCSITDSAAMWYEGAEGKYNGSLGFDGTNDYVSLGTPSSQNTPMISVSAWINLTSPTDSASHEIYNRRNSSNAGTVALRKNSTNLYQFQFRLDGTESTIHDISSNTAATAGWHHIVGTYNGAVALLYVDGVLQTDTEISAGSIDTDTLNVIEIGRNPAGSNYLNGKIDDVQVFSYPLTPLQVKNVMNNSSAVRFGPITGTP